MTDIFYISRCLELAEKGLHYARPNPMVGCVLVKNDKIIGEGFHHIYGGPHAEVNAINSVKIKTDIIGATAYVSLEPCAHFGKTPPCADLLIKHQVSKVVICNSDPYHEVDGLGITKLKKAGIEVVTGVLKSEGKSLNKRFFTFHQKTRPYVILKWAESSDGYLAPEQDKKGDVYWISGPQSKQLVHQWRAEEQAILVGKNTVIQDNPKLDVRATGGQNPIKVILDSNLSLKTGNYTCLSADLVIIINTIKSETINNITYLKSDMTIKHILTLLHEQNITSIFVEGGRRVLQSFIDEGLWDEIKQITGSKPLKKGLKAPQLSPAFSKVICNIGNDILTTYSHD